MTTLHLILASSASGIAALPELIAQGDAILLASDGCYLYPEIPDSVPCYVLGQDAAVRGLSYPQDVRLIQDEEWLNLTLSFDNQVSWL